MMIRLYIIEWKSKQAGVDGQSGYYTDQEINQLIDTLRRKHPGRKYSVKLG